MGPSLIRRATIAAASVWHRILIGEVCRTDVPELHSWLASIDQDAPEDYDPKRDLGRLFTNSLGGETFEKGSRWLEEASLSDIAAWRLGDYTVSPPPAIEDMTLAGGRTATRWVYERITKTYHTEWSPESWAWEAAYIEHPSQVAERAGIDLSVLRERDSTHTQLVRSAGRFILDDLGDVLPGMRADEFIEIVVHHLEQGHHGDARALSEAAYRERSGSESVRSVYAFCWLPVAPLRSREIIVATRANSSMSTAVRQANIAATHMAEGSSDAALNAVQELVNGQKGLDDPAWLWDPASLSSRPEVVFIAPRRWAEIARDHLGS